jgi:hypothetical protein
MLKDSDNFVREFVIDFLRQYLDIGKQLFAQNALHIRAQHVAHIESQRPNAQYKEDEREESHSRL